MKRLQLNIQCVGTLLEGCAGGEFGDSWGVALKDGRDVDLEYKGGSIREYLGGEFEEVYRFTRVQRVEHLKIEKGA